MLAGQILRPFGYLAIKHPYKRIVDWIYPAIATAVTIIIASYFGDLINALKPGAALATTLSFVQSLPGFYIAALAAIATFGRPDIDEILPKPTPKLLIRNGGIENLVDLTRRRFLAILFAFLTAESIAFIVLAIALLAIGPDFSSINAWKIPIGSYIANILITITTLIFYQMIIATFWGLYYLGYKLHE